jgi:acyl carrier protein
MEVKRMSVRSTIEAQFEQVAAEQKRKLARLSDDLKLLDSGLDSLSFALIVARLEDALGFDPFDAADEAKFPVTFSDFVKLYESHPPTR